MTGNAEVATNESSADLLDIAPGLSVEKDVVVSVGTDHHRFDRLVEWIDEWQALRRGVDGIGPTPICNVSVQYGTSRAPSIAAGTSLMPHAELKAAMAGASAIVTHGGPATISDALAAGLRPLVVPRDPRFGEHVDDHQIRFTRMLEERGEIVLCREKAQLFAALDRAIETDAWLRLGDGPHPRDTSVAIARVGVILDEVIATHRPGRWWRRRR